MPLPASFLAVAARLYDDLQNALLSGDVNNLTAVAGLLDALALGRYNVTPPTLTSGNFNALQLDTRGNLNVNIRDVNGTAGPIASTHGDTLGDSGSNVLRVSAEEQLYNESTWERRRGNVEVTALASAARTATTNSADLTNRGAPGVRVRINVTAIGPAPSITVAIQEKDSISGNYVAILTSAAITTTGQKTTLVLYPGAAGVANAVLGEPLPRTWRVAVTHANADSITYSVDAALIL